MSPRAALALAVGTSLALHLFAVLVVPAVRVRLLAEGEHLVEVELREPTPLAPPLEPLEPAEPTPAAPLSPEQAASLGSALTPGEPAAAALPPAASPVRLPERRVVLPEPDTLAMPRFTPAEGLPLPGRPSLPPVRAPGPAPRAAAGLAQALLQGAVTTPAESPDPDAREGMVPLDIEWEAGSRREVVHEPPPPRVPIRNPASVAIRFSVSPRGEVSRAFELQRGDPELDRAALAYIRDFRFNPLPPGEDKEQVGTIRVRFRLE